MPGSSSFKPEDVGEAVQEKSRNPYKRVSFPGKSVFISIDSIRELKYDAKFKLYEGKKKVFIITDADKMRPEAANALLKLLEEPPG
jgi:DNA polymerase-3 subunit delta'